MKALSIPATHTRHAFDRDWRFSFGHASDLSRDFMHGTRYFTHFAKAGFADGPASPDYDDRHWRALDLPHDWAVELPFSGNASHSHGYKTLGMAYPESSVAWYRKSFHIEKEALGSRVVIEFDGIYRDAQVFVNGFWCGREEGAYLGCRHDISEYLRYGDTNTIAVRVDARMEEGWYYEGAGIYRHVWLSVLDPVHLVPDSLAIVSNIGGIKEEGKADADSAAHAGRFGLPSPQVCPAGRVRAERARLDINLALANDGRLPATASLSFTVRDRQGRDIAHAGLDNIALDAGSHRPLSASLEIANPALWDILDPALHSLVVEVHTEGGAGAIPIGDDTSLVLSPAPDGRRLAQRVEQPFGIRSIAFESDRGFLLNGRPVKLVGSNNHQDHAGLGVALPDSMQDYRIRRLKAMGSNAYRCSHHPPTPELLDACDRLGMLVIDENRFMGTNAYHRDQVARLIRRDINHPSVVLWSLGNEEWAIEGNITGSRIALAMQDFARTLDPSRPFTVAISGGWLHGISTVMDVMGYNYISHGSTDEQHRLFPKQAGVGTEETTTQGTRDCWLEDPNRCSRAPVDNGTSGYNAEVGWKHYAERPWLAGLFFWTGFDYRGEPVPFEWPAVTSQFGIMDTCGFEKACFWYLRSWWRSEAFCKIAGHLNWGPDAGELEYRVYANGDEVELIHNGKSLGVKAMSPNGHLSWRIVPSPGSLEALSRRNGTVIARDLVETVGPEKTISLELDSDSLDEKGKIAAGADGRRIAVITVSSRDGEGRAHPTSDCTIRFEASGGVRLLGCGNGDPMSHEADQVHAQRATSFPGPWRMKRLEKADFPHPESLAAKSRALVPGKAPVPREAGLSCFDADWETAFVDYPYTVNLSTLAAPLDGAWFRAPVELALSGPDGRRPARAAMRLQAIGDTMTVWVNGVLAGRVARSDARDAVLDVDPSLLFEGVNRVAIWADGLGPTRERRPADFSPLSFTLEWPAPALERRLFNGKAQIIAEVSGPGTLVARPADPDSPIAAGRLAFD